MELNFVTSSRFIFSRATLNDAAELCSLVNSVYRGESGLRSWTGEAHLLDGQRVDVEGLRETLSSPGNVILIARSSENRAGAKIIGCVHLRNENSHAYLGMLTADVTQQRSGLGSALLAEAERFCWSELNLREIRMTVISLRTELINWYQRRGYSITDERAPFPYGDRRFGIPKRDDLEFVVLNKKL